MTVIPKKQPFIQKLCNRLGENNKPRYTVLAIACGKGTVRPILSITDKKEKPDARKYAALRELMTEFIGVPTTMTLGIIAENLTRFIVPKKSPRYKNVRSVMSFLGICMAAGYFVPKFCNIGMPPVMKKLMPNYDPNADGSAPASKTELAKVDKSNLNINNTVKKSGLQVYPTMKGFSAYYNNGMRV